VSPDNANDQLRIGQILADRYRVDELIGRGGMAEVYRGYDQLLARPVALKVLRTQYGSDPDLRLRFEEEARAAALVSHPNVVAVYDAGEDDSKAFIVMELVSGETLHDRIARGAVEAAFARSIGRQVLAALSAAHAKGVLHRDIKPANVLITPDGQAKVADFGIAKAVHQPPGERDHTSMNMVLGTPSYLAPERAQGDPATVSSDLWSVGVLLYEAVTGVKPFEADNPIAITLAAQQGRYVPVLEQRPGFDPVLAAVIERAIEPEPGRRYSSADEMAGALRHEVSDPTPVLGVDRGLGGNGPDTTQVLGSPTERGTYGLAAGAAGLAAGATLGAGAEAGAGAGSEAGAGSAAGAPATRMGAGGTPASAAGTYAGEDSQGEGQRRRRRGTAVLIGFAVALLLGGLLALVLTGNGGRTPSGTTLPAPRTTKPKSTVPRSTSTTLPSTTSSPSSTTTSTPSTTSPSTTASTSPSTTASTSPSTTASTSPSSTTETSASTPPST
jgi:tRNA A-37 threonylcarbamoyl transferase component Bud32